MVNFIVLPFETSKTQERGHCNMENEYTNTQHSHLPIEEDEIDLLDLLLVLVKNKWLIIGITFLFACGAIIASLVMTPVYKGSTSFIQSPTGTILPAKLIIDIAQSSQILNTIIEKFNLKETYKTADITATRRQFRQKVGTQENSQSGIISISMTDTSPDRAAAIANYMVEILQKHLDMMHFKQINIITAQKYEIQKELVQKKTDLSTKTHALGEYFGSVTISQKTKEEFLMQGNSQITPSVLAQLPDGGAEYIRLIQDIRSAENQYDALLNKFLTLEEEERRRPIIIQVIQKALPPDQRIKPKRTQMVVLATMLGLFTGVFAAFIVEFVRNAANDPKRAEKLAAIRKSLSLKK